MSQIATRLRAFIQRYERFFVVLLLAVWALVCYAFVLRLPFFHDDLPIMTWMGRHTWRDVWLSQENGYYRPLAFTVYRLGMRLPLGARQAVLHAVNLILHWLSGLLVFRCVEVTGRRRAEAWSAALLFIAFPFTSEAIPWITALSHPQVVLLTLLATFAALKAECERRPALWGLSLFAAALAPLAHESGAIAGAIVGGYVLLHCGARSWRRWLLAGACVAVAGVVILGRTFIPGAYVGTELDGLPDLFQNAMFFLHGVLYPLGPAIGVAVQRWGWHDFTLLGILAAGLAGLLVWLTSRGDDRRWTLRNLWWWAAAALPAAVSLKYGAFFVGERLYALAAPGIAMLWAAIIVELGARLPRGWGRRLLVAGLVGGLLAQNVAYLRHKRALYVMLDDVYDEVLATTAAADEAAALAFVNLPASLTWTERTYALTTESAVFVPWAYSNLGEFVEVNQGWRDIVTASHGPLFQETEPFWITQGPWLEGGALRAFLEGRDGVWLGRWWDPEGRFVLLDVGALAPGAPAPEADPRAHFEGGPALVDAALRRVNASHAEIAFTWYAAGAVDAAVFVHVRDAQGNVIAQADGGALHGMLPLGLWQAGDLIRDVRHIILPEEVAGPLDVFVGVYQGDTRFPAFVAGDRVPDEAVFVGRIPELESAATP